MHYAFKTEISLNNEPMFNKHCNNSHCIEYNKGYKLMSWNVYNDFLKKLPKVFHRSQEETDSVQRTTLHSKL